MLSKRAKTVEVADDMESFFYVILYYAARYLASNIEDVPAFIENFFDSYEWIGGAYRVGETKYNAIKWPMGITISTSDDTLVCFSSPLDDVLSALRNCFHSLYVVRKHESRPTLLPLPVAPAENNIPRTPTKREEREERDIDDDSSDAEDYDVPVKKETSHGALVPTDDDRKQAAYVSGHKYFISHLKDHIRIKWPPIDNKGDLIPSNWKSTRNLGPSVTPSNRCTSKRRKLPSNPGVDEAHEEEIVVIVERPEERPEDQPEDQPADQPEEQPVDQLAVQPDKQPVEQLVEQPEEQPTERPVGKKSRVQAQIEGIRRSARLANKV